MKTAFVFPGQGSQSVAMMAAYEGLPGLRETFAEASAVLGFDLWALVAEGPDAELNRTVNTQPAMLAADVAVYRAWRALGGAAPALAAGHSLGEWPALVAAGVVDFADAVRVVRIRAEAMQAAVPEGTGGIAAILGLEDEAVRQVCADAAQGEVIEPANYNSPAQVVIAGNRAAVERGMALAKERGAKRAMMLPMSAPSHCSLMRPAGDKLAAALAGSRLAAPAFPVLHNVDVTARNGADEIRDALVRQLHSPVRWVETVQTLAAQGVTRIVECGPGKVLAGLAKRIAPGVEIIALADAAAVQALLAQEN